MQRYAHAQRQEWLTWFLDPATTDDGELHRSLLSVPDASWPSLQRTLGDRLSGQSPMEHGGAAGTPAAGVPRVVFPPPAKGSGDPALPGRAGATRAPSRFDFDQELADSVTFFIKRNLVSLEGRLRGA
jgi:hypothetical protein